MVIVAVRVKIVVAAYAVEVVRVAQLVEVDVDIVHVIVVVIVHAEQHATVDVKAATVDVKAATEHVLLHVRMTVPVAVVVVLVPVGVLAKDVRAVVIRHVALMDALQHAMSTAHRHVRHRAKKHAILHV